jgi:hypothetical protein
MLRVDFSALSGAADGVDASADALADVDVAGPFGDVSDALVGSQTSEACLWVSTRVGAAVQVYADRLHSLADASRTTVQDFTLTDGGVAGGFGRRVR